MNPKIATSQPNTQKLRHRKAGLFAVLLVCILASAFWINRLKAQPLLQSATYRINTQEWTLSKSNTPNPTYFANYYWLSNHEVLFQRGQLGKNRVLSRYNLQTKQETPLSPLTALLDRSQNTTGNFVLSPNGEWLLWPGKSGVLYSAKTDGTHFQQWSPNYHISLSHWLEDSHHWITMLFDQKRGKFTGSLLNDVEAPQHPIKLPTLPKNSLIFLQGAVQGNSVQIHTQSLENTALATSKIQHTLLRTGAKQAITTVKTLVNKSSTWVVASRHGDYIAGWKREDHKSGSSLLEWIFPFWKKPTSYDLSLWYSRIDGSDFHQREKLHLVSGDPQPDMLEWTPDSKNVSFLYDGTLWVIPIRP